MFGTVDILLSTFQGEAYLKELLMSIFSQTYQNIRLIVRDDGSTDGTISILEHYAQRYADKIIIIQGKEQLGSTRSFDCLMQASTSNYLMFADQDDVWLVDKVESMVKAMTDLESQAGAKTPLLIHSDLVVTNAELEPISFSFWKYGKIHAKNASSLNRLLLQNVVTGCALMMNRPLMQQAIPIPDEAIQHDWWIALVAAGVGEIKAVSERTVLYRQHDSNVLGAKKYSTALYFWRRLLTPIEMDRAYRSRNLKQAGALYKRFVMRLPGCKKTLVDDYCTIHDGTIFRVLYRKFKHRFFLNGFFRNLIGFIPKGELTSWFQQLHRKWS